MANLDITRKTPLDTGLVGASLPVRCLEIRNVRYSGIFITLDYSEFRRDTKAHPLLGRSPLLGVSAKREFEFTVVAIAKSGHVQARSYEHKKKCYRGTRTTEMRTPP